MVGVWRSEERSGINVTGYLLKPTLHKYIVNEIWPIFLASLFVFVFVVIATQMLPLVEMFVTRGVRLEQVMRMVLYTLPDVIAFAFPAASLMGVVLAFLRLSADSEIIALKSCGISLYQMMPPVVGLSFLGFVAATLIGVYAEPWGNKSFKDLIFQIAESKADLGIRERIFSEPFDDVVFYVNKFSPQTKVMKDVFVVDRREKDVVNTIVSKEGRILLEPEEKIIVIQFSKGTIFVVDKNLDSARTIEFKTYDLNIEMKDIMAALESRKKKPKEMSVDELINRLEKTPKGEGKYNETMVALMEKASMPLSVFLMGIIGVPLGVQMRGRSRSGGVGISLVVFLIYYMCLAGSRSIAESGAIAPEMCAWIPSAFLLISCVFLFWRAAKEDSFNLLPGFLRSVKTP